MKFLEAWHSVANENSNLKIVILLLAFTSISLGYGTAKLALRTPLIIERGCYSEAISPSSGDVSMAELESFVKEALHQRFDTNALVMNDFIATGEISNRDQEQKELNQRGMLQHILVDSIEAKGNQVKVNTDRLISVGQVRSAFPFPLMLTLSTGARSETNPYGLTVIKISEINKGADEKN